MSYKIAHDARPQVTTLLLATALSLALWYVPFAEFLAYPFRIFVTFIHEGGHALAAVLTGNSVQSLSVSLDTSGLTETLVPQGGFFSRLLISSAGYLGAIGFGALLLWLVRMRVKAGAVLVGSGVVIAGLTAVFGFLVPLSNLTFSPFTVVAGAAISVALFAAARLLSRRAANFLVAFLAVQCVLNALFDLKTVLFLSSPLGPSVPTDAANMAAATGVPAFFWALIWIGLAFVILSAALRVYAASKAGPSQPDLPFEDSPLAS